MSDLDTLTASLADLAGVVQEQAIFHENLRAQVVIAQTAIRLAQDRLTLLEKNWE